MATSTGKAQDVVVSSQMAKDGQIEAFGQAKSSPSVGHQKLFGNQLRWAKDVIAETRAQRRAS
jgi:hypothetical protein